ncbi:WGR domain-containing protein [Nannocystis sp. SCPEA4]|uniref:WGR domain-containing protein n=1 Tax=Nannocystis sp. SCPEA4 TaxID=2996787 RepID=UPI002271B654|nr:WGR domain-containing protein [Nannocystis sp. SCPEA4]MCY1059360.1 WGR domain-containing protein [Nannocystis sp. SCPEA4]
MRSFLFQDGQSNKFWEIAVEGGSTTVRFGRVGTAGQTQVKSHGSSAAARKAAEALIAEKVKKGYAETTAGAKGAKKAAKAGAATAKKPAKAGAAKTAKVEATKTTKTAKVEAAKATKKPAPPAAASFVSPDERLTKLDRKRLAARLAKEEDEYAQLQLLEEAIEPLLADDSDARRMAYALLWELWANGGLAHATLDPAVKKALLANLAEGVEHEYVTLASRDVLHLFSFVAEPALPAGYRELTDKDYRGLASRTLKEQAADDERDPGALETVFPGWPKHLDDIVVRLGPDGLAALTRGPSFAALPAWQRDGVNSVMRRHGIRTKEFSCNMAARLAFEFFHRGFGVQHSTDGGAGRYVTMAVDGQWRDDVHLPVHDGRFGPELFRYVELFTDRDQWAQSLLWFALSPRQGYGPESFSNLLPALDIASPAQRRALMGRYAESTDDLLRFATVDELLAWAAGDAENDDDTLPERCALPALIAAGRHERPLPEPLVARVLKHKWWRLDGYGRLSRDPARWGTPEGLGLRTTKHYIELLRHLPRDRARQALLERIQGQGDSALIAGLFDDEVLRAVVAALRTKKKPDTILLPHGVALVGEAAIEPLHAAWTTLSAKETAAELEIRMALVYALARAKAWPEALDAVLQFHGWGDQWRDPILGGYGHADVFFQHEVLPALQEAIGKLPAARREAVLARALDNAAPARLPPFVRTLPLVALAPALHERAVRGLAACEHKLDLEDCRRYIDAFIERTPVAERERMLVLAFSLPGKRNQELWSQFVDEERYAELRSRGAAPAVSTKKDDVDRLLEVLAARRWRGKMTTIAALRATEQTDGTYNQRHGAPRGVDETSWPVFAAKDEPMQHLLTLDLEALPGLKPLFPRCRAVALFVSSAMHHKAWEPDTDHVAVVPLTDKDLQKKPLAQPLAPSVADAQGFEVVTVKVPAAIFDDELVERLEDDEDEEAQDLGELRKAVYALHARALGEPIWLQSPEPAGRFVMQLDEAFINMNLGDAGVLFVFANTAFFQCH